MNDQEQSVLYVVTYWIDTDPPYIAIFSPDTKRSGSTESMAEMTALLMDLNLRLKPYTVVAITHTMTGAPFWSTTTKAEVMHAMLETTTTLVLEPITENEDPDRQETA